MADKIGALVLMATASLWVSGCSGGGGGESGPTPPPIGGTNNPPTISGTPPAQSTVGRNYAFKPNASDPDGDSLAFSIENRPPWADFDTTTGDLTGTPELDDVGVHGGIVISASDGQASASLSRFSITVNEDGSVNTAPTISGTPDDEAIVGNAYSFTPSASDADGDSLSFSIQNLPSWAAFDTATGALTGTPQSSDTGAYSGIVISVTDGVDSASLPAFTITVRTGGPNQSPQMSGTPTPVVTAGLLYSFTPTASDPDGDTLLFSVQNLPSWASFNPMTGEVTGLPQLGDVGTQGGIVISASDGQASTSLPAFSITVIPPGNANSAPSISGSPDGSVIVGQVYLFVPAASDADGNNLTFGVLNLPPWASFSPASGAVFGSPQPGDVGVYSNITVAVSDGFETTPMPPFTIDVIANSPPSISGSPATSVTVGGSYAFAPSASDPEGDTLTFAIQNQPSWAAFSTSSGALTGTPAAGDQGIYSSIVVSVSDGQTSVALPPFSVMVDGNGAPTISGSPPGQVNAGENYAFNPVASDPDGDALTFSIQNRPSWAAFSNSTGALTGTPQSGDEGVYGNIVISVSDGQDSASLAPFVIAVSSLGTPSISGSPATSVNVGQNYAFTPTASDPQGDTLTFSIQNAPAWASFSTTTGALTGTPQPGDEGSYPNVTISVSDGSNSASLPAFGITVNASGAPSISGNPPLQVDAGSNYAFTPTASDPEGDTLTFAIQNRPAWATFSTTTGTLQGTPQQADAGTFTNIVISVSDGSTSVALAPFAITVTGNATPTIAGSPAAQVTVGQAYAFTPSASDGDGDTLSFSVQNRPSWASFVTATGRLSGTPQAGDEGSYPNIVIVVSDGQASASLGPFTITVNANGAPTISGTPTAQVDVGVAYSFTPVASDPEGGTLTFSIQNKPSWATFSSTTGTLQGTPQAADAAIYANIVISVSDGQSSVALAPFSITVVGNGAPSITGAPITQVGVGQSYSFTPSASDPDDDTLTFSIQNRPAWAAFSTSTGALTGTPQAADLGSHANIVITVSDGEASASLPAFAITVSGNAPPSISGSPATQVDVGQSYSFTPSASDPNGDPLTFSIQNKPSWASFNTSTGRLSGTPGGSDVGTSANITISVSDGAESASLAPFTITVNANGTPTISGTPSANVNVGASYSFTPTASDPEGDTLTFTVQNKPSWATFSGTTGTLSGTPQQADAGAYSNIVISVSDGQTSASLPAFTISVNQTGTGSVSFSWTPPTQNDDGSALTDLAGYRFYYGTSSGNYTDEVYVDSPGISSYVIENLSPGTYYFSLKAVNDAGIESQFSNEVSKQVTGN